MNRTTCFTHAKRLALGLAVLALAAAPSFAQTIDLCATTGSVAMPDATSVSIWGYVLGSSCALGDATLPGPVIRPTPGATTLTVTLTNNLTEPVSFFVPGLRATAVGGTAGKFTAEAAPGGTVTYTFNLTGRSGTFLYQSATDRIRTQVPMGLYGALVVDSGPSCAYGWNVATSTCDGVAYDQDAVLVYSEIDPSLTATSGGARVSKVDDRVADGFDATESGWNPQYFLINGAAYPGTAPVGFGTGDNVLLRFVNAGLDSVMPTLGGGLYLDVIAEDGNRYPHPIFQYGLELQSGKTIDAMVSVTNAGSYALYDRSGHLTNAAATGGGMLTYLDVSAGAGLFELGAATYSVAENGGTLTVTVNRVGGAAGAVSVDYATADGTATAAGLDYTAIPITTLNFADLQTSATFDITILEDGNYEGDEAFNVILSNPVGATLGTPSSAVVTITENDPGPGVLQLGAATYSVAENVVGGTLTVTVDRVGGAAGAVSVSYATSNGTATAGSDYTAIPVTILNFADLQTSATFNVAILNDATYEGDETFSVNLSAPTGGATLGTPASAVVTIVEDDAAPNVAPFANDDLATAPKNSPGVTFSVTANDVDPDGTIDVQTVVITTGPNTAFGGTVVENNDGTVTYVPRRGFRGTDDFQYTVNDDDGATSNVATVRVNVN